MARVENGGSVGEDYSGQVSRFLEGRRHELPDVLRRLDSLQATLGRIAALMVTHLVCGIIEDEMTR